MSKPQLLLSNADHGMRLSAEEYAEADFHPPWGNERAEGNLIVNPPPGFEHFLVAEYFRDHLGQYRLNHRDVVDHIFEQSWFIIDEETDRIPDITVYLQSETATESYPHLVPDLFFEIVSPGPDARDRDYNQKRTEYERRGVCEYIIVDRFEHRLTVLTLVDGHYAEHVLQPSEAYTSPLLPGLQIPLADVI